MRITEENFVTIIESIKEQIDLNSKIEEASKVMFEDFVGIVRTPLIDGVVNLLSDVFNDESETIIYYIWELDFGRNEGLYATGSPIKYSSGKEIPMKTPQDLYKYITSKL